MSQFNKTKISLNQALYPIFIAGSIFIYQYLKSISLQIENYLNTFVE